MWESDRRRHRGGVSPGHAGTCSVQAAGGPISDSSPSRWHSVAAGGKQSGSVPLYDAPPPLLSKLLLSLLLWFMNEQEDHAEIFLFIHSMQLRLQRWRLRTKVRHRGFIKK